MSISSRSSARAMSRIVERRESTVARSRSEIRRWRIPSFSASIFCVSCRFSRASRNTCDSVEPVSLLRDTRPPLSRQVMSSWVKRPLAGLARSRSRLQRGTRLSEVP